eukprot:gene11072-12240_t
MGGKQSVASSQTSPMDSSSTEEVGADYETCHIKISKRPSVPADINVDKEDWSANISKRRAYSESLVLDDYRSKIIRQHAKEQAIKNPKNYSKNKPAFQEILLWKDSFNSLISHPIGIELFRTFLRLEHSEESIMFWSACEEFRCCRFRIHTKAKRIFRKFVEVNSPSQVNLDYKERTQIEQAMSAPNKYIFDEAQHRIKYLMMNDSYPRFLKSPIYTKLEEKAMLNSF